VVVAVVEILHLLYLQEQVAVVVLVDLEKKNLLLLHIQQVL
jgi:hypothetical protein